MLQDRLGLEINRDKTSVVNVAADGATLDFLGYSFRYINAYVQLRMWRHLRRRSQRSLKPPEGMWDRRMRENRTSGGTRR